MGKYRKKPVVVRAVQWTGNNWTEIAAFHRGDDFLTEGAKLICRTLEGSLYAQVGDWIIEGVKGEIYPCKPDIFEATYEPVEER